MRAFFEGHKHLLDPIRKFPFAERAAYSEFLAQTHHYVAHTTRLLGLIGSRIGPEREKLHSRFMKHAGEERSHHLLAAHDLAELGGKLADYPALPAANALQECQYYRVLYGEPTAIFGHIIALEGVAVTHGRWVYETAAAAHGKSACTFVKLHVEEDQGHMDATFAAVEMLTDRERQLIRENFVHTCAVYAWLLDSMAARACGGRRDDG